MTVSVPIDSTEGAFQFLGGLFLPAHYLTGEIMITALTAEGKTISDKFTVGDGEGGYTELLLSNEPQWEDTWLVLLSIESYTNTFEVERYTPALGSGAQVVFDDLKFIIDWTVEHAPDLVIDFDVDDPTVPEPASLLLFACGGLGLLAYRRKRA